MRSAETTPIEKRKIPGNWASSQNLLMVEVTKLKMGSTKDMLYMKPTSTRTLLRIIHLTSLTKRAVAVGLPPR